jgi:hypothetical protein
MNGVLLRMWAVALLALVLAGCEVLRGIEPSPEPGVEPVGTPAPVEDLRQRDVERLLDYFARARKMPVGELGRENESVRQAYARAPTDLNRMRLAMLLSLPNAAFNDEARALELLDPLVKNPQSPLHALAFLMSTYIQEQKRLTASLQAHQQNIQGLQQNLQGLQNKLDALRSLERSLIEREQGATKKR